MLVTLGIFFLTSFILGLKATVASQLVTLDISFLTSFILALKAVLVARLVESGVLFSIILILALYTSSFTILFILHKSAGIGTNLSTLFFKLLKLIGTFFNVSLSDLFTSDFKLVKSDFLAKSEVSTLAQFFKSTFVV